ncbi:MAG: hypothetical protein ACRDI2_26505, partial [Chloroflexota bacterium]
RLAWQLAAAMVPGKETGARVKEQGARDEGHGGPGASDAYDWNQALMDLGATICTSRAPRCLLCPARESCSARAEWLAADGASAPRMVAERPARYADAGAVLARGVDEGPVSAGLAGAPGAMNGGASGHPARGRSGRRGAPAAERAERAERFEGSRRWYRGRIVDALRALPGGATLSLEALGRELKPDFSPADAPWLIELAQALARDGLVELAERDGALRLSLPA